MQKRQNNMKCTAMIVYVVFSVFGLIATADRTSVWEHKYQYELFERILNETKSLKSKLHLIKEDILGREVICPKYWIPVEKSCYYFPLYFDGDWKTAESACENINGYLAIIDTCDENENVKALFADFKGNVWIGAYRFSYESSWRWINGEELNYTDANTDYSGFNHQRDHCMQLTKDGWVTKMCKTRAQHFICEYKSKTDL